ncbi:MAG: membrane or secreted protein [Cyclobacteriaceae bacterium]
MKILKFATLFMIGLMATAFGYKPLNKPLQKNAQLIGAWEYKGADGTMGMWIITEKHFSVTFYSANEFQYTEGGTWSTTSKDKMGFTWEYHTRNASLVGETKEHDVALKGKKLTMAGTEWTRIDNGSPGALAGAWLITGRYVDGEMSERTPGVRRTMKILSGTKFQWIAYNVETKEFFGTGGGSYTTNDGKYTENIEFFSRDNSRVGASLQFDFKIENGKWRHSGKSSKGDPLDEVWTKRDVLGI